MEATFAPDLALILGLTAVAVFTGFIDAIAGGGGLVMMPALLASGLPPHLALGTNKLQSVFGTTVSAATYARGGLVDWRGYRPLAVLVFLAAGLGALVVQAIPAQTLAYVVPALLLLVAGYVLLSPRMTDEDARQRLGRAGYAPVAGSIGFYDGIFGPGTGQFFTASLVALRGHGLTRAAANTKFLNAATNWAAVAVFAAGGKVVWVLGFAMAAGAMIGGFLGSRFAMRHGARIIRPLMLVASLGLTGRLIWQWFAA